MKDNEIIRYGLLTIMVTILVVFAVFGLMSENYIGSLLVIVLGVLVVIGGVIGFSIRKSAHPQRSVAIFGLIMGICLVIVGLGSMVAGGVSAKNVSSLIFGIALLGYAIYFFHRGKML